MTCEIISYCPPPGQGRHPEAFLANIQNTKTVFPLALFSDHPPWGVRHSENPNRIRNPRYPYFVSNFSFLLALQYAIARQLDRFIYLEDDCRVRDYFDEKMMTEAESIRPDFACAGSPVCYNASDSGHSILKKVIRYANAHLEKTGLGMPILGYRPDLALYTNGGLAIYNTKIMAAIFRGFETDIGRWACNPEAWDIHIGYVLFKMFGEQVFELVVPLSVTYSGCGNKILNETDRIQMLESGKVCGVHQIKSSYRG